MPYFENDGFGWCLAVARTPHTFGEYTILHVSTATAPLLTLGPDMVSSAAARTILFFQREYHRNH